MENNATSTATQHTKVLTVQNKMGIHARPAAMIVRITNKFKADVLVERDEEQVNGKSIMGLMMLAAGPGSCRCPVLGCGAWPSWSATHRRR